MTRSPENPPRTILVVDDDPAILEMLEAILTDEGFVVHAVPDARRALAHALNVPPDLILTDLMMPFMDGRALLAALREHPRSARILVVATSAAGHLRPEDTFDAFIAKPFSIATLLAELRRCLP